MCEAVATDQEEVPEAAVGSKYLSDNEINDGCKFCLDLHPFCWGKFLEGRKGRIRGGMNDIAIPQCSGIGRWGIDFCMND